MSKPMIFTATISHKYGINVYHGKSPESLQAQIFQYVCDNWQMEMGGKPKPEDELEAISIYFDESGECREYFDGVELDSIQ